MLEFLTDQKFLFPDNLTRKDPNGFCGTWTACVGLPVRYHNTCTKAEGLYSSTPLPPCTR